MVYRRFYLNMVTRILLITLTGLLFVPLIISGRDFLFSYISLSMIFLLQLGYLIYYTGKVHRNLEEFLLSVREQNLSISFSDMNKDKSFIKLNDYFHEINEIVSSVRREKEAQWQYLQFVIENIDVGVIATGTGGVVELWNKAAANITGIRNPGHVGRLDRVEPGFGEFIAGLEPGMEKLKRVTIRGEIVPLAFRSSRFTMEGRNIDLISFQNIKTQLEDNELDSWQKLIRVLTHEIMNSVAPLSSLSSTLNRRFSQSDGLSSPDDESLFDDTRNALRIIETRSRGLIDFVGSYRKLTKIPELNISVVKVNDIYRDVYQLMHKEAEDAGVRITVQEIDPGTEISADKKLVEQILINLVKNAIECFDERPSRNVDMRVAESNGESIRLQIANNGPAIPPEVMDRIFVPFFSTKEKGSGIGLSFTRQIMRLHGGNIEVTTSDSETVFSLRF
jgi:two-component system, NtrC family, nitrogen regulation sensor histidine kinase NtrY